MSFMTDPNEKIRNKFTSFKKRKSHNCSKNLPCKRAAIEQQIDGPDSHSRYDDLKTWKSLKIQNRRHLFDVKTNHKSFFSTSLNITHCCCMINLIG